LNQETCEVSEWETAFLTVEGGSKRRRGMISCGRLGVRVCLKSGGEVVEGKALEC